MSILGHQMWNGALLHLYVQDMETTAIIADLFTVIFMAVCWTEVKIDRNGRRALLFFVSLLVLNIVALMR